RQRASIWMNVAVIGPSRLPKLSRAHAVASRALERRLLEVGQVPVVVDLNGVGALRIELDGIETAPLPPAREEIVIVGKDGRRGVVAIDLRLALTLVAGVLGRSPPSMLRGLGTGERGILAGMLAAVLGRLESLAAIDFSGARRAVAGPLAGLG